MSEIESNSREDALGLFSPKVQRESKLLHLLHLRWLLAGNSLF